MIHVQVFLSDFRVEEGLAKYLEASESRESLPVWRDWVSATRQCQAKTQASGVPWSHEELRHIRDPQTYTNFCKTHIYGSWAVRDPEMIPGRKSILAPQKIGARKEYRDSCFEVCREEGKGGGKWKMLRVRRVRDKVESGFPAIALK